MKKILLLFVISLNSCIANDLLPQEKNQYVVRKEKMKVQLTTILKDVKRYKATSERKNKRLLNELDSLKKKFNSYKNKKKKEIKSINNKLSITTKKMKTINNKLSVTTKKMKNINNTLSVTKKEMKTINNKLHLTKKELSKNKKKLVYLKKKNIKEIVAPKKIIDNEIIIQESIIQEQTITNQPIESFIPQNVEVVYNEPQPATKMPSNTQWVEMVVQDEIDIYQLALLYYGDPQRYREIYSANQHVIGKDLKINNGMSLRIPMTDLFEEQPMLLNTY